MTNFRLMDEVVGPTFRVGPQATNRFQGRLGRAKGRGGQ